MSKEVDEFVFEGGSSAEEEMRERSDADSEVAAPASDAGVPEENLGAPRGRGIITGIPDAAPLLPPAGRGQPVRPGPSWAEMVEMVCDPNFRITSLSARWPGSCHDARIWRTSALYQKFENGDVDGILLGDSGYPLTKYLLTPYLTPRDPSEERFNSSLCRTRFVIEQTFGILKRKFQALHFGLRTTPDQAVTYITACSILHNIGVERKDTMISSDCRDLNIAECQHHVINGPLPQARNDGIAKRISITQGFF